MSTTKTIEQTVKNARNILVMTHIGPDGDALGSLTAMGQMLVQWNKQYTLVCNDHLPERFNFLTLFDRVQKWCDLRVAYDLTIALDCGDEFRMGPIYSEFPDPKPTLINIDHHATNTHFGDINLVNMARTSTTEILYELFSEWEVTITADIAQSLLTGLVTDTLGFRTIGVTANTLKVASVLMDAGADLSIVTMRALNTKSISTLKLWQIGLNRMKLEDGLMWTTVTNEERMLVGHMSDSSAGLVNLMADVDQVAISAVLLEIDNGSIHVGFRCYPPYSVAELALNLGGGGHALAAGCTLEGPLAKAETLVVELTKETIRRQSAAASNGTNDGHN